MLNDLITVCLHVKHFRVLYRFSSASYKFLLTGWLVGWLAGWLVGWLVHSFIGWFVGWFVGSLVD